jgi:hypothetical protein
MSKTTNKFSPEVRARAVRMGNHPGSLSITHLVILSVSIRRVPRCFDLHAVLGAMFCCFFQFQGSNS